MHSLIHISGNTADLIFSPIYLDSFQITHPILFNHFLIKFNLFLHSSPGQIQCISKLHSKLNDMDLSVLPHDLFQLLACTSTSLQIKSLANAIADIHTKFINTCAPIVTLAVYDRLYSINLVR